MNIKKLAEDLNHAIGDPPYGFESRSKLIADTFECAIKDANAEIQKLKSQIAGIVEIAHQHGWNGVDNSKILSVFINNLLHEKKEENDSLRAALLEISEIDQIFTYHNSSGIVGINFQVVARKALAKKQVL